MSDPRFCGYDGIYLLSHSVGLAPVATKEALNTCYFGSWERADATIWTGWLEGINRFRDAVAQLLCAETTSICPQQNLSSAFTKILHALPRPEPSKNVLLMSEEDFPSMGFVAQTLSSMGWQLRFISSEENTRDIATWKRFLVSDVYAVLITHVQSNTGCRVPVQDISKLANKNHIYSIVDVAQSAGVLPINTTLWSADFIIGSCVKWLCGGPGAGFLWVNPSVLNKCQPLDVGWFSHENPLEFDIHKFRYAKDALRFWGGTPAVSPFIAAAIGIETLCDIGIQNIAEHNRLLKLQLIDALSPNEILSPENMDEQGGSLIIKNTDRIESCLKKLNVHFDKRRRGIRLSPHIYNSSTEIEQLVSSINKRR